MTDDPGERTRFSESLAAGSTGAIRRGLERWQIIRPWKRRLAEAELDDRLRKTAAIESAVARERAAAHDHRRAAARQASMIALLILAVVVAATTVAIMAR